MFGLRGQWKLCSIDSNEFIVYRIMQCNKASLYVVYTVQLWHCTITVTTTLRLSDPHSLYSATGFSLLSCILLVVVWPALHQAAGSMGPSSASWWHISQQHMLYDCLHLNIFLNLHVSLLTCLPRNVFCNMELT